MLWSGKAVPGYKTSIPFLIAIDNSRTKLVMVNTVTRDILDITVLKRNHPNDIIIPDSI